MASVAFDAWWTREQASAAHARASAAREQASGVPGDAPSWWYGRGPEGERRLYDRHGPARRPALDTLPLDGGYAPWCRLDERRRGRFRLGVVTSNGDVYTILSWWDLSRDGAHLDAGACFIVRGDHAYSSAAMVAAFPLHFPGQAIALAAAGVELEEE